MKPAEFQVSWFDLVTLTMLVLGAWRGRKRGVSEELLDMLQWVLIVTVGAHLCQPVAQVLVAQTAVLGPTTTAVIVYLLIALLLKLVFTMFKRSVGQKLVESDVFGNLEYYLGIAAGALRFGCMLLFALALLNAKHVSSADLAASAKRQQEAFGSISFPTLGSLQQEVFVRSFTGKLINQHLHRLLIQPPSRPGGQPRENVFRRHERTVEDVMRAK